MDTPKKSWLLPDVVGCGGGTANCRAIADAVIFDAIRDRLEHSALTVNITGDTYRGVKARKLASKKKDA
jgi:hypothetical protein